MTDSLLGEKAEDFIEVELFVVGALVELLERQCHSLLRKPIGLEGLHNLDNKLTVGGLSHGLSPF